MIHFGMPTLIETRTVEECAVLCSELGLRFVELSMDLPEYQLDRLDVEKLRRIADKHGIYYTIHLSGFLNPCDFNSRIAQAYTEVALDAIRVAKRLNAPIVNMHLHSGDYFTMPDGKVCLFEKYEDEYLQKLTAFRNACEAEIEDADIQICVENCGCYEKAPYLRKGLALLLESATFAQTLDIGHNAAAGYSDEPTIMQHVNKLAHFHIHDARGKQNHMTLGEGEMDLAKYLGLAELHNCRAVVEVKTVEGLRRSLEWLNINSFN